MEILPINSSLNGISTVLPEISSTSKRSPPPPNENKTEELLDKELLLKTKEQDLKIHQEKAETKQATPVKADEPVQEKKQPVRPDKNPNTKIGRAAMDIMERKKKAAGSSQTAQENSTKKRGRKPKA